MNSELAQTRSSPSRPLVIILAAGAVEGAVAFRLSLAARPELAWKVFLVNFIFWSGISIAGLVFSAILELTHATWPGPVREIAESFAGFLPVSLALYFVLLRGASSLYPWIHDPPAGRERWFDLSSFTTRDVAAILLLYGLGFVFLAASRRRRRHGIQPEVGPSALAVLFVIVYALTFSLLTIDLVMSLSPGWTSTLFPAYFFMGNLYAAIAVTIAACYLWRSPGSAQRCLDDARAHDMGKILLGFSMLWTYLFWSQYLVIWYGNLPEELGFVMLRTRGNWENIAWGVLILCSAIPFVTLLARATKRPGPLFAIAIISIAGVWLERFLLVAPSETLPPAFSMPDLGVTVGFAALFALAQVITFSFWGQTPLSPALASRNGQFRDR